MSLVVQKYGGSSVADAESIKRVARRIVETRKAGNGVCVVVSAMGDTTDNLLDLAEQVSPLPPGRELDMLLTSGERISMALLAMAIANLGFEARSFTGSQAGVITDAVHGKARIIDVTPGRIQTALDKGYIAIVAGFQGVSMDTKDITTLGRGGSDTTAVALAAALTADVCEIYTDVDGVFTADPRIVPTARKIHRLSNEEMLEMAACGAKILHLRCVEYARRFDMPIHVRSSFSQHHGTWITDEPAPGHAQHVPPLEGSTGSTATTEPGAAPPQTGTPAYQQGQGDTVESPIIAGVAHDRNEAKITVVGVPDRAGMAATIFQAVAKAGINIDMIVQNISASETGLTDISFTLPTTDGQVAMEALAALSAQVGYASLLYDDHIGKLSLIGAGMRSHPGVSATLFQALADANINIEMISTSEIRVSVVTRDDQLDDAVRAVHTAFGLDSTLGEAVIYGGTGR